MCSVLGPGRTYRVEVRGARARIAAAGFGPGLAQGAHGLVVGRLPGQHQAQRQQRFVGRAHADRLQRAIERLRARVGRDSSLTRCRTSKSAKACWVMVFPRLGIQLGWVEDNRHGFLGCGRRAQERNRVDELP